MIEPLEGKAFLAVQDRGTKITAFDGAVRSSKTHASSLWWIKYVRNGPAGILLMTGKTERTIIQNVLMPLQAMLGKQRVKINRGNGTASILGREVLLIGATNEGATSKIQGLTLAGAYVDEASTLPESFFNMLYSRLSVPGAQIILTCNPEGPEHWLKKKWLDRARIWIDKLGQEHLDTDTNVLSLFRVTFILDDNTWMVRNNPDYIADLKNTYVGLWYRRYIESEWVAAEGAIYDLWQVSRHVIPWASLPPVQRWLAIGIDYGTTNATAAVLLAVTDEYDTKGNPTPRLVVVDEWRWDSRVTNQRLTDAVLSKQLREWMQGLRTPDDMPIDVEQVILDPSAASFREQLWTDGVNTWEADNEVTAGISEIASLLGNDHMIVTDRCKGLILEAPAYSWDPKATEKGEDKPLKVADHDMDAWRYAVHSTRHLWRPILAQAYTLAA